MTPTLVRSIAWAARSAGAMEGMRLSHFGRKRLEAEAKKLRIAQLVARAGHTVRLEEINAVLAGAVLPPRKHILAMRIRQAAILCEAARYYADRGDRTTPETFATYRDFAQHGHERAATLWSQFAGRPRERLLELHRGSVPVPDGVATCTPGWTRTISSPTTDSCVPPSSTGGSRSCFLTATSARRSTPPSTTNSARAGSTRTACSSSPRTRAGGKRCPCGATSSGVRYPRVWWGRSLLKKSRYAPISRRASAIES